MSLYSSHQEPVEKKDKIYLINPSIHEFKTSYLDNNNKSVEVVLPPLTSHEFSAVTGSIILNHLVNFILNQSGFSYKTDVNLELARIRKTCILYE